ncbi:MAG: 2,3-bisphosphoglycerate-independent phosphoglycerate mutase, partial [Trueperaceae bacterium]|nr:2,3-bisphosphoglycerate-independent phosphoglycerate mutase [Trueperaceae bacterium]
MTRPVLLVVLDGFGLAEPGPGNAVALADTPTFDAIWAAGPHTTLEASGPAVGLPPGQMGNSEVGHLNLGAGRVVPQSLSFVQDAIDDGSLFANPVLTDLCDAVLASGGTLHLMGLVSDGGVHADLRHLVALVDLAHRRGLPRVAIHAFTDGRDTAPDGGRGYLAELEAAIADLGSSARVRTVIGRYYAMDRDRRWERVQRAWDALVHGRGAHRYASATEAIAAAYARGETDEFVAPTIVAGPDEAPARVADGDAIFVFNFRADRARQLAHALLAGPEWDAFDRGHVPDVRFASLMQLDATLEAPFALALPEVREPLAEVIARAGLKQHHTAETEKYPHVTYFFDAKREEPFPGETRYLEPSPKVPTYDLQPEMSAPALAAACARRLREHNDAFILINFANPDMVGHTGVLEAAVQACEAADAGLAVVLEALVERGGAAIVVADHGNAERMLDDEGHPHT